MDIMQFMVKAIPIGIVLFVGLIALYQSKDTD